MIKTKKYYFVIDGEKIVIIFSHCKKNAIEKLKRNYKTAKDGFIYKGFTYVDR